MEPWSEIRRRVLVEGVSRRPIIRETGLHWDTLKKILSHSEPPGYRQQKPRRKTKLGPYLERVKQILKDDQAMPPKPRHTAKRLWERLRQEGFTGGYTGVKDAVRELTQRHQEGGVPLVPRPGEAQVDFGYALAKVNGQLRKVAFFVMALPYGNAAFVMAFEREGTETFGEGPAQAFEFFGGVPRRITDDNTKVAVAKILGGGHHPRRHRPVPGYPRQDWRATLFSLDGHPHLRAVRVAVPNLAGYRELVGGAV